MTNHVIIQQLPYRSPQLPYRSDPQLNLLGSEPPSLLRSLTNNLRDLLFPEKQAPLRLTSRPVAVRGIWEQRHYGRTTTLSLMLHGAAISLLVFALTYKPAVEVKKEVPKEHTVLYTPADLLPVTPVKGPAMQGGGGGGTVAKLEAPKGHLPKQAPTQITPPAVEIKNDNPKLAVEPTVAVPTNIKLANNSMPNIGDPVAKVAGPASNGVGSGGGIGAGKGTGIGIGVGGGVGQGSGGGYGGGVFKVGGGVAAPVPIFKPEPEFTEEARRAKHQGTVMLALIVGADGLTRDIRVVHRLGMGLDEKAIESARQWKFQPATKDGRPVAVAINIEVDFTLH
jgi:TonB family protein